MKPAYVDLIQFMLGKFKLVTVWDGGDEPAVELTTNEEQIIEAIEAVEQVSVYFYEYNGQTIDCVGSAVIIPYGVDPDETVVDYSLKPLFEEWEERYLQ